MSMASRSLKYGSGLYRKKRVSNVHILRQNGGVLNG